MAFITVHAPCMYLLQCESVHMMYIRVHVIDMKTCVTDTSCGENRHSHVREQEATGFLHY